MIYRLFAVLFAISSWKNAESQTSVFNYLTAADTAPIDNSFHKINLQKPDDFSGLEVLEPLVAGHRVFITGENHDHVVKNGLIEFKLLRFLHEKAGVRNLLLELGEARGWYANRYVNDIDTHSKYCLQATTSVKHMKALDEIRTWNLTLPAEQRIQIHGIDVERFNDIALMRLSDFLPKTQVPENLYTTVHAIHQAAGWLKHNGLKEFEVNAKNENFESATQPFSIDQTLYLINQDIDSLEKELKKWLGSGYPQVQQALNSIKEYNQWVNYKNSTFYYTWREENMYRKLTALLNKDTAARFFGQFGRCHSAYTKQDGDCGWYAYKSVVHRLQNRYFQSNKGTLSIGIFYEEEPPRTSYTEEINTGSEDIENEIKLLLQIAPENTVSIARLDSFLCPLLSKRFSFCIAVREFSFSNMSSKTQENWLQLTFGLNALYLNNTRELVKHLNPDWQGNNFSITPLTFGLNGYVKNFTVSAQLTSTLSGDVYYKTDNLSIRYLFSSAEIYAGWRFLKLDNFNIDAGPKIFHATESIQSKRLDAGFLKPDPSYSKMVKNHAVGTGFQVRMHCRVLKKAHAGLAASYLYDVSNPDWFVAKTNIYYARNLLQTKVTGRSFSVFFNFDL